MITLLVASILAGASPDLVDTSSYATGFPSTENPISENGMWINAGSIGLDWHNVRTTPGLAFGTQAGANLYDDSVALLTGTWGNTQTVSATVHSVNPGATQEEVEVG